MRPITIPLLALLLAALLLAGCGGGQNPGNAPYEPDTPAPAPHDGVFVSPHGALTFNGDGESLALELDAALADRTGLPAGYCAGTYVFLSGELPPNGSVPVRYDAAHEIRVTVGEQTAVLALGLASEDGKTASVGVGVVTAEHIPLLFFEDGKNETVLFEKEAQTK